MSNTSLWPSFGAIQSIITPKMILKEQAVFLENVTSGYINTEILTSPHPTLLNKVSHVLKITAPVVENYSTAVVQVDHDMIKLYPLTVTSRIKAMPVAYTAADQDEYLALLKRVFEEKETLETIQSLLAQSRSNEK
jgi:hypothetical protein